MLNENSALLGGVLHTGVLAGWSSDDRPPLVTVTDG
jgi:hypothetical protein